MELGLYQGYVTYEQPAATVYCDDAAPIYKGANPDMQQILLGGSQKVTKGFHAPKQLPKDTTSTVDDLRVYSTDTSNHQPRLLWLLCVLYIQHIAAVARTRSLDRRTVPLIIV